MRLHPGKLRPMGVVFTLLCLTSLSPQAFAVPTSQLEKLRIKAKKLEKNHQWGQACALYDKILQQQRDYPQARAHYLHCLRRFYQVRRHTDKSFRKDVLGLRFAHSMRFYEFMANYLLDNALDHEDLSPEKLYRKGLEELGFALQDPTFIRVHLKKIPVRKIENFRASLSEQWANKPIYSVQDASNQVRELAKTALRKLKLRLTVTVMEFTCGSCYAVDDYTMYLSPGDLRKLCHALKGDFVSSVRYDLLPKQDAIGYIAINDFSETTIADVDDALMSLNKMGMKALILDLRGNRGGLVESAVEVARRFLSSGVIVSVQTTGSKTLVIYQARNPDALTIPLVVLVDSNTASAAEILAGALKDNGRAHVVGQTTYGKGCIQELYRLAPPKGQSYPGGLRLTVSRFYSPGGTPYSGRGVIPDILVEPAAAPTATGRNEDPQMQAAINDIRQVLVMLQ